MKITDTDGDEITRIPFDLDAGEESVPLVLLVYPSTGARLKSTAHANCKVMGREHGTGSAYVDLSLNDGIDLVSYPVDIAVPFDIKVVALTGFTGRKRFSLSLAVTRSLQAGYAA